MRTLFALLALLNHEEAEPIRLQRDGVYPFLGYADLNPPPAPWPLPSVPAVSSLIIIAVGLPVLFLV